MVETSSTASADRALLEALKASCLTTGVRIRPDTMRMLGGPENLTIHEYSTTGGITLAIGSMLINAPFDEWYCDAAAVELSGETDETLRVTYAGEAIPVDRVLPLPGYLGLVDRNGHRYDDVVMSHADRARLSPIAGCAFDCDFCDIPSRRYERRGVDRLVEALEVALGDPHLPVRHAMISGGSPGRRDHDWFADVCRDVLERSAVPLDVMMASSERSVETVERLVNAGIDGFSINLELYGAEAAGLHIRGKHRFARPYFGDTVAAAVDRLGRSGRVRSLIIPGLESPAETLAGIEYLASLGCDPVISPFRPARGTSLAERAPIASEDLLRLLAEARAITAHHGVQLGPRCIPCQHNTLTFPWDCEEDV